MKFLCVDCEAQMASVETSSPGDGTLAVRFRCPRCEREVAMLTNPMETQMVNSLCVDVGGRTTRQQPFESLRSNLRTGGGDALQDQADAGSPGWSEEAELRLARVPGFVRGMVRRLYCEWAQERGIVEITVEVMDRARGDLGLEGM
jgi:hypothetical protein